MVAAVKIGLRDPHIASILPARLQPTPRYRLKRIGNDTWMK
jgi:hypothetical protein